jgi:hypothetical protein
MHARNESDRGGSAGRKAGVPQVLIDSMHQHEHGAAMHDGVAVQETDRRTSIQTDRQTDTDENERALSQRDTYKTGVDVFARSNGLGNGRVTDVCEGTAAEKGFWASINR